MPLDNESQPSTVVHIDRPAALGGYRPSLMGGMLPGRIYVVVDLFFSLPFNILSARRECLDERAPDR